MSTSDYIDQVFGPRGFLARRSAAYEPRSAQVELARFIDEGLREHRHAMAEAPCGTGKSLAYCVPAIHHARAQGKKVVISTANIALQEQLLTKDLPMLAEVLPWPFSFAVLKGRNQYLCADRLAEMGDARQARLTFETPDPPQLQEMRLWALRTSTGDRSELSFEPERSVWSRVSTTSTECRGERCPHRQECFAEAARARAAEADLVVINHHLLFAALASPKLGANSDIFPADALIILDEAHEAADIARDKFGFTLQLAGVRALAKTAFAIDRPALAKAIEASAESFFAEMKDAAAADPGLGKRIERPVTVSDADLRSQLEALMAAMRERVRAEPPSEEREWARDVIEQTQLLSARLAEFVEQRDWEKVYWVEATDAGAHLRAKCVLIDEHLARRFFGRCAASVLVSATLAVSGDFSFIRREMGAPSGTVELAVRSPFEVGEQGLLVIPSHMPLPGTAGYADAVARAMQRVIDLCEGRTLCLFTSYEMLRHVQGYLRGHRVLCQGEGSRNELVREFRRDVHSVLLGTGSFWTGIDVPGEALSAVVIDKLPFPHPEDPLVDTIHARDRRAFWRHSLPRASIALRQGVGRLLRTRDDVGVAVLLDRRAVEKSYAPVIRRLFTDWQQHTDLEVIPEFLERARGRRIARAS